MLEKIIFISLISSFLNDDEYCKDCYLEPKKDVTFKKNNSFICIQIDTNLTKGNFYILIESKEENSIIDKNISYNYTEYSCQHNTSQNVSFNKEYNFSNQQDQPNLKNNDDGFHYEYKLNKADNAQKYILMLVTHFNGTNNFTVKYNTHSVDAVLIYVVVVVASLLGLIIIAIIIVCKCYVSKKAKQMAEYAKDGDESLVGETNEAK